MTDTTRRKFLAAAGLTTAAGVAAVAVPEVAHASSKGPSLPSDAQGTMAAYVHDVRQGQLILMVGDEEAVVNDKELIARLSSAFHSAKLS